MKRKRIIHEELLEAVRELPCMACSVDPEYTKGWYEGGSPTNPTHPHHIRTRGAGGDDVPENLMPLCALHHRQIHDKGLSYMASSYGTILHWLSYAGWTYDDVQDAWIYPSNGETISGDGDRL